MKRLICVCMSIALFIGVMLVLLVKTSFAQLNELKKSEHLIDRQAEVSPGVWVKYREYQANWNLENTSWSAVHSTKVAERQFWQIDTSWLSIPWHATEVTWVGVGVPICLRCWKDELYLIVFDRDSVPVNEARFRFYHQTHGVLAEIAAKDFPREIATQNLWLKTQNGYRDGKAINEVEVAKALDPASVDFQRSFTARIWLQCETGEEYDPRGVDQAFLGSYLKKYAVERLLQILPTATTQSSK